MTSQIGKLSLRGIEQLIQRPKPPTFAKGKFQTVFSVSTPGAWSLEPGASTPTAISWGLDTRVLLSMIHFSLGLILLDFLWETTPEVSVLRQTLWTHWAVNKVTEVMLRANFTKLSDLKEKQPGKNQSSEHRDF